MTARLENRRFLRLVLAISIVANGAAALVVQGERGLQPFAVASTLDRYRMNLTDDIAAYGATVHDLHERGRAGGEP
ncbi:MAG: hypothetical protein AABZ33_07000 [Chloroflexota bacterium]